MESTSYVFPFRVVFFYVVTTGWIFEISLCENPINQSSDKPLLKPTGIQNRDKVLAWGPTTRERRDIYQRQDDVLFGYDVQFLLFGVLPVFQKLNFN